MKVGTIIINSERTLLSGREELDQPLAGMCLALVKQTKVSACPGWNENCTAGYA